MEYSELLKENLSISEAVLEAAKDNLNKTALTYLGRKISYKMFYKKIKNLSLALYYLGIKKGDVVLVALPNIPQAVYLLYALNRIGAVPAFVSPISAQYELEDYINKCKAKVIIAFEDLYDKIISVLKHTGEKTLIITSALDEARFPIRKKKENALLWRELFKLRSDENIYLNPPGTDDTAVILFSGGTTGKPKAVELTNLNLNALAAGTEATCGGEVRNVKMLSVLPVFHGFGLGICIHTVLYFGGECILAPRFEAENTGKIIRKQSPQYLAVVPAMLKALMKSKSLAKADLSKLLGVFVGGDSLSKDLEEEFNSFLFNHKSTVKIRQGYGLTECVAPSCLMPSECYKSGSVGKPYPDTLYKIVRENTLEQARTGAVGEICISGKTVMKGYFADEAETAATLKIHSDGRKWLHTGDVGFVDTEGFVYFKGRMKRIIVTKGNNIYPSEIEKAFLKNDEIKECCVVGVKDKEKGEIAVAFAVMHSRAWETEENKEKLFKHLEQYVSKQAMPKNIYFTDKIPRTQLGKVAFAELIKTAEKNAADHC